MAPVVDLIFEHRPDEQAALIEVVRNLIEADPNLKLDTTSKTLLRFAPVEWYELAELMLGQGWTQSGQMLLFECDNRPNHLKVVLYIGSGHDETRRKLFSIAQENTPLFRTQSRNLNQKRNSIFSKKLLQRKDYEESQTEDLKMKTEKVWKEFVESDLPKIMNTIRENIVFC